jgi:hypothetical protein
MQDVSLMEIFALTPSTVSRYITFSLEILIKTLRKLKDAEVRWPQGDEFDELSDLTVVRHPLLHGAFGSIDGLNLPVQTSADEEIENATYNGWLHSHFVSSVLAFSTSGAAEILLSASVLMSYTAGLIIGCCLNAPGSWHDSRVARPIYEKLHTETPDEFYLIADTAFPRGTDQIEGRIRAPMKESVRATSDNRNKQKAKGNLRYIYVMNEYVHT